MKGIARACEGRGQEPVERLLGEAGMAELSNISRVGAMG
jgi:hypothetical protein